MFFDFIVYHYISEYTSFVTYFFSQANIVYIKFSSKENRVIKHTIP